ncbi:MAG: hypothetical protein IKV03_02625 [Alphaproteobacteria bacterium]|nr:hypothetical protein [Alphaproteobacteria bacterium]
MKKIALSLLCAGLSIFFTTSAMSQELVQSRKAAVWAPALLAGGGTAAGTTQPKKIPLRARTTILRFEPGQIELSDIQKEMLMGIVQLFKPGNDGHIVITAAASEVGVASKRAARVEGFFNAYRGNSFACTVRFIPPRHVVPSVDNTVKIVVTR